MTERDYTTEVDDLGKKLYELIDDYDEKLVYKLAYLCGIMFGTMCSMEREIYAARIKNKANGD